MMRDLTNPISKYIIALPVVTTGMYNFTFTSSLPDGDYEFTFRYFNDKWNVYVFDPLGNGRVASVYPNVIAFGQYPDFSIQFTSDFQSIGLNDLAYVSMYILYWK